MAFNVDNLLNTNSTPTQEQRHNIQNFVLEIDEDISDINVQILAMQAKILVLQTRRAHLFQQRRCYSSLLSPIRCLPIEIFGKIFDYATHDRPRHVLNISAVCHLWRNVALGTPKLWSTLELGHHTTRRNMDNYIDSRIERAHSYPLSLVIKKPDPKILHRVLTLISKHRLKSITIDSSSDDDPSILSSILFEKFEFLNLEMLESFSLTPAGSGQLSLLNALRCAPKLKTLNLKICDLASFDMLPFPWRQLTSLTIEVWNNYDMGVGDILQACEKLEEFIVASDTRGPSTSKSITLNHLRKLHTYCIDNSFLSSVETPSIHDFALKCSSVKYLSGTNLDFHDYIEKNGSTLLKLSIAPSHRRLVKSVPFLRSLVELKLYDNDYDDNGSIHMHEILRSLVVNPEMDPSTMPLPRLEALEIICQATEEIQKLFVKVIESRWWSDDEENARLKQGQQSLSRIKRSVLLNVHTELNMFCRNDVDVLRAQGMSIEYLAPFDGMYDDDFYTSRYYMYPDTDGYSYFRDDSD